MSTTQFPAPGPGAGINSQIDRDRAQPVVIRNSRFWCFVTGSGSLLAAFFAVCMALMVFSLVFQTSGPSAGRVIRACQWGMSAFVMGYMCRQLWKLGRAMAGYQVVLDGHGVNFNLGTKKRRSDLFLAWDQIAAIKCKRAGNVQQYFVQGADGSEARFSSYTFFRPGKVAGLIAERTGLAIQKA